MNIGKSIRIALVKADKDQNWLAEQIDIPQQEVSRIINQPTTKRLQVVGDMATAFDLSVSEFIALGEE